MSHPDSAGAVRYALDRLRRELAPHFSYHSPAHTEDVIRAAADVLAERSAIPAHERMLLRSAAAFHDLGFVVQHHDHERISCRIAVEILPQFGYSPVQIAVVTRLILATRLPQAPGDQLERIMADADLDVLGRDDFLEHNRALRREHSALHGPVDDARWFGGQLAFLKAHRYWTPAAHELREAGKQRNIDLLRSLLAADG